jgi:hypothetical protein
MLEQLGCSREVGLWLATELQSTNQQKPAGWATDSVMVAMKDYMLLLSCAACISDPQVAAMHLSLAASCLQWLSSMPPDKLLRGLDDCSLVCDLAGAACSAGQVVMQQQQRQQRGQDPAAKGWAQLKAANYSVGQLSAALLEKVLTLYHGLTDSMDYNAGGGRSSSGSSNSGGSGSSTSATGGLNQLCHYVVTVLAGAIGAATAAGAAGCGSDASTLATQGTPRQALPLIVQCCQVLQDYVRTLGAAELLSPAAVQAASAAHSHVARACGVSSSTKDSAASMSEYVAALLSADFQHQPAGSISALAVTGPAPWLHQLLLQVI